MMNHELFRGWPAMAQGRSKPEEKRRRRKKTKTRPYLQHRSREDGQGQYNAVFMKLSH